MARKSRDYDNPVIVTLKFKDGKTASFSVSNYRVEKEWVVLTRADDSRVTKYVNLDTLSGFTFDEPLNYRMKIASDVGEKDPGGPVSNSPIRDRMVATLQEVGGVPVPAKRRAISPKEAPKPEITESEMVRKNMAGVGTAMMGG